jgi:hypothetical protein
MGYASSRVQQGGCRWDLLDGFRGDLRELQLDEMTLRELKGLMTRAATGTVRSDEWEYPLRSGGNMVGELRLDIEALKYRLYYNEPALDMELLLAVVMGLKVHDDEGVWFAVQQGHIQTAKRRLFAEGWR